LNPRNLYFSAAFPAETFTSHPTGEFSQVFVLKFIMKCEEMGLGVQWPNDIFLVRQKVG
jgi:biotin-(acetyl-CoA carboxylase) ligase